MKADIFENWANIKTFIMNNCLNIHLYILIYIKSSLRYKYLAKNYQLFFKIVEH